MHQIRSSPISDITSYFPDMWRPTVWRHTFQICDVPLCDVILSRYMYVTSHCVTSYFPDMWRPTVWRHTFQICDIPLCDASRQQLHVFMDHAGCHDLPLSQSILSTVPDPIVYLHLLFNLRMYVCIWLYSTALTEKWSHKCADEACALPKKKVYSWWRKGISINLLTFPKLLQV